VGVMQKGRLESSTDARSFANVYRQLRLLPGAPVSSLLSETGSTVVALLPQIDVARRPVHRGVGQGRVPANSRVGDLQERSLAGQKGRRRRYYTGLGELRELFMGAG
jgi:hypothetical protein